MAKLTTTDLTQLSSNETSAVAAINANGALVETAMENTLSLDGTTPNAMTADLDMNGNTLLNAVFSGGVTGWSWLGAWVTATAYVLNDVVSNSGNSYICVTAHTAGTFATDLAAVKWEIVSSKGDTGSVTPSSTDTFTNKTFDADATGNVITNIGSSEVKSELITGQTDAIVVAADSFIFSDVSDSGNLKDDTVQGILDLVTTVPQADQIAIEAETNENTYIPPDLIKHCPGMAKGWVYYNAATSTVLASYNVTITDNGTGDFTVNWTVPFSSANYCVIGTSGKSTTDRDISLSIDAVVAGSARVICEDTANNKADGQFIMVVAYGDQ